MSSLTDKVIKNTYYLFISQLLSFIFPIFLTPFIISKIGEAEFGLYALVLGFIGTFGLFDISLSSSFVKFISEYYYKKEFNKLGRFINTGLITYTLFSAVFVILGYFFSEDIISLINIPEAIKDKAIFVLKISLFTFFAANASVIFVSILISRQMMYQTTVLSMIFASLGFIANIVFLSLGYGLKSIILIQLISVSLNTIVIIVTAKRSVPEYKFNPFQFDSGMLKSMSKFGFQMQISKLSSFASEKIDEFLLAYFSVLNNVTFFNISNKLTRVGRFLPYQLVPQVAPVAAELNSRNDHEKLRTLFTDASKYFSLASIPLFIFMIFFSDVIVKAWMGEGYDISSHILRILVIGQLVNSIYSTPGNSITPNIGIPKYQMYEGLINLVVNVTLSFFFIKYYGIIGAAYGNTIAVIISSLYVFFVSAKFFNRKIVDLMNSVYLKPLYVSALIGAILFFALLFCEKNIMALNGRLSSFTYLAVLSVLYFPASLVWILSGNYLDERNKIVLAKVIARMIPSRLLQPKNSSVNPDYKYSGELISFFIVTHNRLHFIKSCIENLLPALANYNYEIIIFDNNSNEGTKEYLKNFQENKRFKIVFNKENVGINGKSLAAEECKGEYLIGIDDDVIEFPSDWLEKMLYAYNNIPSISYLATDVVQDETTTGAKFPPEKYRSEFFAGGKIELQVGPTGGWCYMLSRKIYTDVGKLLRMPGRIFFSEDGDYINRCIHKNYRYGILAGVKVYHATGEYHNKEFKKVYDEKMEDYKTKDTLFEFKNKLRYIFSLKKYLAKIQDYSQR